MLLHSLHHLPSHKYRKFLLRLLLGLMIISGILISAAAQSLSAGEAAEQARARTGGKVLQVKQKSEGSYRVKVLMPNGQVRSVSIRNQQKSRSSSSKKK